MVGTFREPCCGRSRQPIHSIPYCVAQPLERGSQHCYSLIQGAAVSNTAQITPPQYSPWRTATAGSFPNFQNSASMIKDALKAQAGSKTAMSRAKSNHFLVFFIGISPPRRKSTAPACYGADSSPGLDTHLPDSRSDQIGAAPCGRSHRPHEYHIPSDYTAPA